MFKLTSKKLVEQLQRRAQRLASSAPVGAHIHTPPALAWWYYQEFGTAGPYTISPTSGPEIRLPVTEEYPQASRFGSVTHPGLSPKSYLRDILPEIRAHYREDLMAVLLSSGYDPVQVQSVLMEKTMPEIKEMIAVSMAEAIQQHRTDPESPGKLGEAEPADVYRELAQIIEGTE